MTHALNLPSDTRIRFLDAPLGRGTFWPKPDSHALLRPDDLDMPPPCRPSVVRTRRVIGLRVWVGNTGADERVHTMHVDAYDQAHVHLMLLWANRGLGMNGAWPWHDHEGVLDIRREASEQLGLDGVP